MLSSLALGSDGEYYNVNADQMASACAIACHADTLIFLTDVPGVKDAAGIVMPWLTTKQVPGLIADATVWRGHAAQTRSLQQCFEERRWTGPHSSSGAGGNSSTVLFSEARIRHGGDRRMSLAAVIQAEQKLLLPTYDRQKVLFVRGRGVYLWDSKGKRYLDFVSGIGVNALGHAHPAIQKVLKQQAGKLIHTSNLFITSINLN